jgi:hypothetical protein
LLETWLDNLVDSSDIALDGYSLFCQDRTTRGGGVAVYVRKEINVSRLDVVVCILTETLWLKILTKLGTFHFGVCYVPQTISEIPANSDQFMDYIETTLDILSDGNSKGFIFCRGF